MSPSAWNSTSPAKARPEQEALANLKEAIELHFEPPRSDAAAGDPYDRGRSWGGLAPTVPRGQAPPRGKPALSRPARKAATSSSYDALERSSILRLCQGNPRLLLVPYAAFSARPTSVPKSGTNSANRFAASAIPKVATTGVLPALRIAGVLGSPPDPSRRSDQLRRRSARRSPMRSNSSMVSPKSLSTLSCGMPWPPLS